MPRRRTRNSRHQSRLAARFSTRLVDRTVITISGKSVLYVSNTSATVTNLQVAPGTLSSRLDDLRSSFTSFRFTALSFKWVALNTCGVDTSICYYPSTPNTAPATITAVVEAATSAYHFAYQTTTSTLRVPNRVLFENDYRWWRTSGSLEAEQGRVYFGTSAALSFTVECTYTCQFCAPTCNVSLGRVLTVPHTPPEETKGEDPASCDESEAFAQGDSQHPMDFSVVRRPPPHASHVSPASSVSGKATVHLRR